MNPRLIIVGCSNRKRLYDTPMPAIEVYDGVYFRTIRKSIEDSKNDMHIYILSAKYGLINSNTLILDYDKRMSKTDSIRIRRDVTTQLTKIIENIAPRSILIAMGATYLNAIDPLLLERNRSEISFTTGRIGEQLKALKTWIHST